MRTDVPFRLVGGEQPLVVVAARFNDAEIVDCVLDTGASHVVLLPEVAARLGVPIEETREARGAGGPLRVQVGRLDAVALGDAVARDLPVLVAEGLRQIGRVIGEPIGGGIGFGFLSRFLLTLDYERRVLTLRSPDEAADAGVPRAQLPFTLAHASKPLILVPVVVGAQPLQFALDTGASTSVISPAVARLCGVDSRPMPAMAGGGGAVAASAAVVPSLGIGPVRIERVRVAVAEFLDALGQATGARIDGILGTNVLRRFRVTIDYPGHTLRLD